MKHIVTKILLGFASVIAFFWGVMSVVLNGAAQEETTGSLKIVVWYMVLSSLLFVLFSIITMLRITTKKHTQALQKGLYAVTAAVAMLYSLLLAFHIAPQIPSLFTAEMWKQSSFVMALVERALYLVQGVLFAVLSVDRLRGKLKRRGELTWIAAACVVSLLIPYGLQFFGVGLYMVMTVGAGAVLTLLTVCQAAVVYGAFASME